jgi:methylmalonyl-CoA mutase N-terminal domain/subunit
MRRRRLEWEETVVAEAVRKRPERDDVKTFSGIPVRRLYGPEDRSGETFFEKIGLPGQFPFTRGVQPTGYRSKMWTRRPITGFRSARDTNERVKQLLRGGQSGLHFVFDYPTLAGYDSDHPLADGEVGVSGIPIDSLEDARALLDGIDLSKLSISYSHWGPYIMSFLLAHADEQGIAYENIAGTTQNDVLMYYHSCPWWDLPLEANLKLFVDLVEFTIERMPRWNAVSISGYNIRDGGCSAIQEIAFTFGDAIAYLDACAERGLPLDEVSRRFSFMLCAQIDFFEEVCKMRAMRRMWATIIRDRYGISDPSCQKLRVHAQTSGTSLTAQQPYNNIVRGTVQALASIVGGAQSLHVSCFDETYGLPTEEAIRVSLNTQNVLAEEAGVANTVDPLGGSYFVESLTDELEERAWELLDEIDRQGGMVRAARSGWVLQQKHEWAEQYQREVDSGRRRVVGVNSYEVDEAQEIPFLKPDAAGQQEQIERVQAVRANRDETAAQKARNALRDAAAAGENIMPYAIDAARNLVTLGEMYAALRDVYGEVPEDEKRYM